MESDEPNKNLKEEFDGSKDISGMNKTLRKIFSFENYVWISNQTYKYGDEIKFLEETT